MWDKGVVCVPVSGFSVCSLAPGVEIARCGDAARVFRAEGDGHDVDVHIEEGVDALGKEPIAGVIVAGLADAGDDRV